MKKLLTLMLILLMAFAYGCILDGDDGDGNGDNGGLIGEYIMTQYSGTGEETDALYISMNFAGGGTGTYEMIYSSSGYINSGPFTYSVDDDGTFLLTDPDREDDPLHGIVSSDGESFTLWLDTGILVGIKKSSGMSNASLSGEYIMTEYFTDEENESFAEYYSMNFAGDGTGTLEIIYSSCGDAGESDQFTYSVNNDGTFSITVTEDGEVSTLHGIVSSDGESFTMVLTQSEFAIFAGIKKSSGMSNVSLSGEYIMIQYITENETSAEYMSVNFDGDGTGTYEIIYSTGGDEGGAGTFTYSVNDDGTLYVNVPDEGDTFQGIVSSDGESFTMALMSSSGFGINAGIAKSD